MKLIVKGKYVSEEQLPKAILPANAVRFIEPESTVELNKQAMKFTVPAMLGIALLCVLGVLVQGRFPFGVMNGGTFGITLGVFLSFAFILPHELLHGLCFGRESEVELYYSLKDMMAFVTCTEAISKARFIWVCLCPNVLLGWLPLLIWALVPLPEFLSALIFGCSTMLVIMGAGDYLNVRNALKQMPRGSMQQMSGFHSYWYMP